MYKVEKHTEITTQDKDLYILGGILLGCGLLIGTVATLLFNEQNHTVSGKEILDNVKATFEESEQAGPIEGSWIELQPINKKRFNQNQVVFFGGISRKENNQLTQYEFYANAQTGDIIDIYKVS